MKYSHVTVPYGKGLSFFALLMMCCTIFVHISAAQSLKNDYAHETRQDLELPSLIRQHRAIKTNGTANQQDIEKWLKIIKHRDVLPVWRKTRQLRSKIHAERISNARNMPKWLKKHVTRTLEQRFTSSSSEFQSFPEVLIIPWTFFNFNAFRKSHQRKASYNLKALGGQKRKKMSTETAERRTQYLWNKLFGRYSFVDYEGSKFCQPPKKTLSKIWHFLWKAIFQSLSTNKRRYKIKRWLKRLHDLGFYESRM